MTEGIKILISKFELSLKDKGYAKGTIESYVRDVKAILGNFPSEIAIMTITEEQAMDAIMSLKLSGNSDSTIVRKNGSLIAFYKYMGGNNPFKKLGLKSAFKSEISYLNNCDAQTLKVSLHQCKIPFINSRNKAMFGLMIGCGIKTSEIISLKLNDISVKTDHLTINGIAIGIPLSVFYDLKEYIKLRKDKSKKGVFFLTKSGTSINRTTVFNVIKEASERSKIHANPSILRHTFAVNKIKAGYSLNTVATILGISQNSCRKSYGKFITK